MKLHVFNPEHDIALAHNDKYFTAPKAARKLRADCGFLPALWASAGDLVLVENKEKALSLANESGFRLAHVDFVSAEDLGKLPADIKVAPWGWDKSLVFRLKRLGLKALNFPDEKSLNSIRDISNRRFSSHVLNELRNSIDPKRDYTVGKSAYLSDIESLNDMLRLGGEYVLKEPWSSSGRGVRRVGNSLDSQTKNWVKNIIQRQGGIMLEPYYNKVCDFGMEFGADKNGVHYRGLSVFNTANGFYSGNLIASEDVKNTYISKFFPIEKLSAVSQTIEKLLSARLHSAYLGPLGVDMMIVDVGGKQCLHPMVEINMRRTMGHVAIDLTDRINVDMGTMSIKYNGRNYNFNFESLP